MLCNSRGGQPPGNVFIFVSLYFCPMFWLILRSGFVEPHSGNMCYVIVQELHSGEMCYVIVQGGSAP